MRRIVTIIFIIFLGCKDTKNEIYKDNISVNIAKKEMLDSNSLLVELWFTNNSTTNYLIPIFPNYMLENRKKLFNPVFGQIITSDFTDNIDYKMNILLENYTERYLYKGASHESYKMAVFADYEGYANSVLFIPKKTKRKMFLIFNLYENCNDTPQKCNAIFYDDVSRISFNIINQSENIKALDSLLKKEKIDYTIYNKDLILKDSLFINK
ncbi:MULTISPECIES: hypothetical protein [unclassified Chryseobacterium]|uniref:hypothetical protein n=1 Tax=unclassified Chryseobacterium TaxID=2593645 RepID=UPI0021E58BC0|nr:MULTISPECIES: hypothetical protein [unclassified Chryseobacterium]MEA1850505.1 hypothetical protein [Chryseobacterium sp. MHB01]